MHDFDIDEFQGTMSLFGDSMDIDIYEEGGLCHLRGCHYYSGGIYMLSEGIEVIDSDAFRDCYIDELIIPSTVRKICTRAITEPTRIKFNLNNGPKLTIERYGLSIDAEDEVLFTFPDRLEVLQDQMWYDSNNLCIELGSSIRSLSLDILRSCLSLDLSRAEQKLLLTSTLDESEKVLCQSLTVNHTVWDALPNAQKQFLRSITTVRVVW